MKQRIHEIRIEAMITRARKLIKYKGNERARSVAFVAYIQAIEIGNERLVTESWKEFSDAC